MIPGKSARWGNADSACNEKSRGRGAARWLGDVTQRSLKNSPFRCANFFHAEFWWSNCNVMVGKFGGVIRFTAGKNLRLPSKKFVILCANY